MAKPIVLFKLFIVEQPFSPSKYGVGIDMGKDEVYACVSAIDNTQRVKVRATHAFKNEP